MYKYIAGIGNNKNLGIRIVSLPKKLINKHAETKIDIGVIIYVVCKKYFLNSKNAAESKVRPETHP